MKDFVSVWNVLLFFANEDDMAQIHLEQHYNGADDLVSKKSTQLALLYIQLCCQCTVMQLV